VETGMKKGGIATPFGLAMTLIQNGFPITNLGNDTALGATSGMRESSENKEA